MTVENGKGREGGKAQRGRKGEGGLCGARGTVLHGAEKRSVWTMEPGVSFLTWL